MSESEKVVKIQKAEESMSRPGKYVWLRRQYLRKEVRRERKVRMQKPIRLSSVKICKVLNQGRSF